MAYTELKRVFSTEFRDFINDIYRQNKTFQIRFEDDNPNYKELEFYNARPLGNKGNEIKIPFDKWITITSPYIDEDRFNLISDYGIFVLYPEDFLNKSHVIINIKNWDC